jgi:N-formylglutamate deformylase
MKSMGNEATPDGAKPRADVVISDLDGNSSSIEFLQLVKRFILEKGLSVSVNDPYKGGTLLKELAKPSANIHGLQIELNRALYLDEAKVCKTNNFPALQQIIQQLTLKICDYLEATK